MTLTRGTNERYAWRLITAFVVVGHLVFVVWATWIGTATASPALKKLQVQTVVLTPTAKPAALSQTSTKAAAPVRSTPPPPPPTAAVSAPTAAAPAPPVVAKALEPAKSKPVPTAKPAVEKVVKAPAKPTAKPLKNAVTTQTTAQTSARQKLLTQAQNNLVEASKTSSPATAGTAAKAESTATTALVLPSETAAIATAAQATGSYANLLSSHLKQELKLPEYGAVTLSVTLDREGHILKFTIATATSVRNRTYIESMLPQLQLPPLPAYLAHVPEHTVELTLTSATSI